MKPNWIDRANQSERPPEPPRSGRGATTKTWREYAVALGYPVSDDAGRGEIMAIVDAGPPPSTPTPRGVPRVEGPVYEATEKAIAAAGHLTELDQATVALLLRLASEIDGMDQRPSSAPVDNWTVPTYHRIAESLGLTPTSRMRLELKPAKGPSKLGDLRAIRGGRAAG